MAQRKRQRKSRTPRRPAVAGDDTIKLLRGPSKARLPGSTKAKTSRHKRRVAWFSARVTWPLREAPLAKLQAERKRVQKAIPQAAPAMATAWQLAGPTNIGGRCTALVCDPANPDRVWIGAAGGGVWASTDAGRSWMFRWRTSGPLQIGALAIDPTRLCGHLA